jgi:hypothetical protein
MLVTAAAAKDVVEIIETLSAIKRHIVTTNVTNLCFSNCLFSLIGSQAFVCLSYITLVGKRGKKYLKPPFYLVKRH